MSFNKQETREAELFLENNSFERGCLFPLVPAEHNVGQAGKQSPSEPTADSADAKVSSEDPIAASVSGGWLLPVLAHAALTVLSERRGPISHTSCYLQGSF